MIQNWFMVETFWENASFTVTPATSMLWGDPNLMFNVKNSLFSSACICITAIAVSRSYRHILKREYTPQELSPVWLFFFYNVIAKWFLHLDSKPERKGEKKKERNSNKQIFPVRALPALVQRTILSLHTAWGIQLLGPQAISPLLRLSLQVAGPSLPSPI